MHEEVEDAALPPADDDVDGALDGGLAGPASIDLVPGKMVTDKMRLVRKLGDGGMGTVWIADHLGLGSQVVLKFMSPSLARDERWTSRFRREAELAARVRHPHVVQVFDHGVSNDGVPFIVMELLEGHDLAQEIWDRGRLPPGEVSTIVLQVAKALQRVHELGFVHRDVKPENIFLCDLGSGEIFVKLLDFGIAKTRRDEVGPLTSTGVTMGTPYYMSPEVIVSAKHVDRKTDLWALAVVAYEALTGERPFVGETIAAIALALHAEERPRPTAVVPALPPELDAWFEKALSRDPQGRFADARTMARGFSEIAPPIRTSLAPALRTHDRPRPEGAETEPMAATRSAARTIATASRASALALAAVGAIVAAVALAWPTREPRAIEPLAAPVARHPLVEAQTVTPADFVANVTPPAPSAEPSAPVAAKSASPGNQPSVTPSPAKATTPAKKPKPKVVQDFNDIE